ncbi:MFS transporter [Natronorubrum bangense]|uniref:Major facilitator family multidrug efflux transporter n=2 Tax=Natronorubrum bangense TaxID=61858 RepID=L9WHB8_9EURY|nr:MFS transporter [Natronorubrum bangense]ELY48631.1 major facilitator family multidrug efflux transporter [Natronorubrum bangense JCM 10635]QCC53967.1 MFS transporter [Natronorubrum bangense]
MTDAPERRTTLWVILASATLTVMAGAILGPIVPAIQSGLGVSESNAGLIITTHGALIVLVSPIAGALIDRVGPRRPFIFGLLLYAAGGGAGLVVDSFGPLLASRAVLGVGVAFVYTGITVLIYQLYEGQRMERALGLRSSANSVGAVIWPLVGGALGTLSWQAPFGVYLVALPLGLLAVATIPETGIRGASSRTDAKSGLAGVLAVFRRRPGLLSVYLLYFGANVLLYSIVIFYPQLLAGLGITSSLSISLYLAANGLAGGVSAAVYDRLIERTSRHALVAAALGLWLVSFAGATVAGSALTAVPSVVAFGLGLGLVFPSAFAWIEALAPAGRQGQFSSYLASAGYTGQFLSPVLFGPLVPLFGVRGVFGAAATAAMLGIVALAVVRGR